MVQTQRSVLERHSVKTGEGLDLAGRSYPVGATLTPAGANFSIYSRNASGMELLLFDREDDPKPSQIIGLDPDANCTYYYWHVFVPGVKAGQLYGFHVHGRSDPSGGFRFDPSKVLLDPYGRGVTVPKNYTRGAASAKGRDDTAVAMKSVVVDSNNYDWEGDTSLRRPVQQTIVYEMHVRGFTAHPSSGVPQELRGTYAGVISKIPYLQELGVTAVELLPVFQFDAQDAPGGRVNYWGYAPVSYFAPHQAYSSRRDGIGPVQEFRDMVKALHRAGIEVFLDVVFNHTAEDDETGPTFCFRGIDNSTYYILENGGSRYANFSGTGNTLNGNHPIVRRLIVDSLRYWVEEMHVDGFRFDLAAILSRDSHGQVMPRPPVLLDIDCDPVLAGIKIIAEAWDAAGLYEVGSFVGDSWREWNGRFRDDLRSFIRSEDNSVPRIADRVLGSPEMYTHKNREAEQSVNFVTCHDGFTLNDLVCYNEKHNEANGEDNRDGANDNRSWNCGVEGPSDDPAIEKLRNRQVKNLLTATLLSLGLPMIVMGDEVRRTQGGNNNAYCQDTEISWLDWGLVSKHADVHRFVRMLIAGRRLRRLDDKNGSPSLSALLQNSKRTWHGVKLNQPDWSPSSHSVAISAELPELRVHYMMNFYWEPLDFELPSVTGDKGGWRRWIDTSLDPPNEIVDWQSAPAVTGQIYQAGPRSVAVLIAGGPS